MTSSSWAFTFGKRRWSARKQSRIGVDQVLVDTREVHGAERGAYVIEEAPGPVEQLANAGRRQPLPPPREHEVEASIEELPERPLRGGVADYTEMHGDVAAPGVLAKDRRTKVPALVAETGEIAAIEAWLERCRNEHRPVGKIGVDDRIEREGDTHACASGGKYKAC